MNSQILIKSKDLDCGYDYAIHISLEQAQNILNANPGDIVSLGKEGAWAQIDIATVRIRSGAQGGVSEMSKEDVLRQINESLDLL